ncbi:MAG: DUF1501 domain-containing protein [Pseudomonadota bacterium]
MKNKTQDSINRRHFLRSIGGAALGSSALYATMARLQMANALVVPGDDYKALVCVFLLGGNDAFNMIVPSSTTEYEHYLATRKTLAIDKSTLLPISPTTNSGVSYGLHPSMTGIKNLFDNKNLSLLANVGSLIEPTSKTAYNSRTVAVPPQLFSHNDQQTFMQSLQSTSQRSGWMGRAAELMNTANTNQNLSMNISLSGSNLWQTAGDIIPYSVDQNGVKDLGYLKKNSTDDRERLRAQTYQQLLSQSHNNIFQREFSRTQQRAWNLADEVKLAIETQPAIATIFPANNNLATSLKMVANIIAARNSLQMTKQTFFIGIGDYDTHGDQLNRHVKLLQQLSEGLSAFYAATVELGVADKVTTFTASDFGRTLTSNGDGTDHGWGSHQMIMGGAVAGGDIIGTMPSLQIGSTDDIGEGRVIPTTSMDQYAATLANWYGVPGNNFTDVFPNLINFSAPTLPLFI